ncbi:MAG: sigma-70 family RNA polymerase sigma factor [Acidimicrobiaceae bacterium]|nr:sigma-70 family RNA polymerase sigma factor [Acidimicrobiaceae bacterium]
MEALSGGDALLVERIRAGDDRALAAIYDEHGGLVYGLARRVARDEQLARDVTQEVFTYLWEMPHRVDLSRGSLRTHLALLAHRRAVDEVRRRQPDTTSAPAEREDGPETPAGESAARTWGKEHSTALDTLPAEQQTAVQLAYYDGLTYVQVAKRLGIPEGTAKTLLRTALARLQTLLTEQAREGIS